MEKRHLGECSCCKVCGQLWTTQAESCPLCRETDLPLLLHSKYDTIPGWTELVLRECVDPGFCRRVPGLVVGCKDYGSIRFSGETDIRWLNLDNIISFGHREVTVYSDEETKPPVGSGLNKSAEVTLSNIQCRSKVAGELVYGGPELKRFEEWLKRKTEEQGAKFLSYDPLKWQWKFQVEHFSRFGLDDSDEDESLHDGEPLVTMDAAGPQDIVIEKSTEQVPIWQPEGSNVSEETEGEGTPMQGIRYVASQSTLPHLLPQQLRLDPSKMQQMKTLFFSAEEEVEDMILPMPRHKSPVGSANKSRSLVAGEDAHPGRRKGQSLYGEESPKSVIFSKHIMKVSPQASWKHPTSQSPSPLTRHVSMDVEQEVSPIKHSRMLLSIEGKKEQHALKRSLLGFENKLTPASCMYGRSDSVVDAALFLGCSFRVGWGPHGVLVHSGNCVGVEGTIISSMIHVEKVALDRCVRDEEGKVRDELTDLHFLHPLSIHMSLSKVMHGTHEHSSALRLRLVECNRGQLSGVCDQYEDLLVKQHAVEGLSACERLVLRHQVMTWHLLSVLFSEKPRIEEVEEQDDEDLDNMNEKKASSPIVDPEMAALVRRADFSSWLQDSVRHLIQEETVDFDRKDQLKEVFSLLTGRQLDDAVQEATSRGDIRLACLISQAGGSMINRSDVACQIEIWENEGLDFSLIERDMVLLYKLLAGDIQGALEGRSIDWKRFLGLLMWYHLAPDTQLPDIIKAYSFLVEQHVAPPPIPMYIEEGALHGLPMVNRAGLYDTTYYLMLLHANQSQNNAFYASKLFSSFSSTYDTLDHRMAWLQHGLLESIGVLTPTQLHLLDMSFVSQLLSIGECHWAIYVALHMQPNVDYPLLHERVVKEILNQYCEVWSSNEVQKTFIEKELGVPAEWLHEALGTYWQYRGDANQALRHLLRSMHWHRAHTLLMTSVAATLYLNGEFEKLLEIVTTLERHKMDLDDWTVSGGIYADYFVLKNSFQSDNFTKELGSFERKTAACKLFFQHLKESLVIWDSRWEAKNRVVYSRMAHELATSLLAERKAKMINDEETEVKLQRIVMDAPVPEDVRLCRLQGAAASFTSWLLQTVPK